MSTGTLVGLALETALERADSRSAAEKAALTRAPSGRQNGAQDGPARVPYIVREKDGGLVYALFRVPDPAKEHTQNE